MYSLHLAEKPLIEFDASSIKGRGVRGRCSAFVAGFKHAFKEYQERERLAEIQNQNNERSRKAVYDAFSGRKPELFFTLAIPSAFDPKDDLFYILGRDSFERNLHVQGTNAEYISDIALKYTPCGAPALLSASFAPRPVDCSMQEICDAVIESERETLEHYCQRGLHFRAEQSLGKMTIEMANFDELETLDTFGFILMGLAECTARVSRELSDSNRKFPRQCFCN